MHKPINVPALRLCLRLLSKLEEAARLAEVMVINNRSRISAMEEFIRANYTGDEVGFTKLQPIVLADKGSPYPYYRDLPKYGCNATRMVVQQAQKYIGEENNGQ